MHLKSALLCGLLCCLASMVIAGNISSKKQKADSKAAKGSATKLPALSSEFRNGFFLSCWTASDRQDIRAIFGRNLLIKSQVNECVETIDLIPNQLYESIEVDLDTLLLLRITGYKKLLGIKNLVVRANDGNFAKAMLHSNELKRVKLVVDVPFESLDPWVSLPRVPLFEHIEFKRKSQGIEIINVYQGRKCIQAKLKFGGAMDWESLKKLTAGCPLTHLDVDILSKGLPAAIDVFDTKDVQVFRLQRYDKAVVEEWWTLIGLMANLREVQFPALDQDGAYWIRLLSPKLEAVFVETVTPFVYKALVKLNPKLTKFGVRTINQHAIDLLKAFPTITELEIGRLESSEQDLLFKLPKTISNLKFLSAKNAQKFIAIMKSKPQIKRVEWSVTLDFVQGELDEVKKWLNQQKRMYFRLIVGNTDKMAYKMQRDFDIDTLNGVGAAPNVRFEVESLPKSLDRLF